MATVLDVSLGLWRAELKRQIGAKMNSAGNYAKELFTVRLDVLYQDHPVYLSISTPEKLPSDDWACRVSTSGCYVGPPEN